MLDLVAQSVVHMDSSWINFDVNALFQNFWSATFDGLTFGAVYGLIAVGYTLVYGVLTLINFAHSEVFIVGAYGVVITLTMLGFGPSAPTIGPTSVPMPPTSVIRITAPEVVHTASVSVAKPSTSVLVAPASPASAAESTKATSLKRSTS